MSGFEVVIIFLILGFLFVFITLLVRALLAKLFKISKPTKEKLTSYECGEKLFMGSWIRFNPRFFVIAIIFIIFDVEILLLLPWAVVYKSIGLIAFIEMAIFVFMLVLALAYVWAMGDLEWIKTSKFVTSEEEKKIEM